MDRQRCWNVVMILIWPVIVTGCAPTRATGDLPPAARLEARSACSALAVVSDGHTVFGANLDYRDHCRGQLFINPRGLRKTGLIPSTSGTVAEWVSRYASVTFNFVGYQLASAGMNERGLTMSTMALPQSVCPPPDHRPTLDSGFWMQYLLDTCASVEEVIAADAEVRTLTVDQNERSEDNAPGPPVALPSGLPVAFRPTIPALALDPWHHPQADRAGRAPALSVAH